MPVSFIQYGQLKQRGIAQDLVRGYGVRRQPDETWRLPEGLKARLRVLLQDLGFDMTHEIWVRDFPQQNVFRLTQRANEEQRQQHKSEWLNRPEP
jgi:hypothetical protein